jgi:hypothetical protein
MPERLCGCGCGASIDGRAGNVRYLSPTHRQAAWKQRAGYTDPRARTIPRAAEKAREASRRRFYGPRPRHPHTRIERILAEQLPEWPGRRDLIVAALLAELSPAQRAQATR